MRLWRVRNDVSPDSSEYSRTATSAIRVPAVRHHGADLQLRLMLSLDYSAAFSLNDPGL